MRAGLALLGLLVLALAAQAHGHGGSLTLRADQAPYAVQLITYDTITPGEQIRIGWNVTHNATGERVRLEDTNMTVRWLDTRGALVSASEVQLQQPLDGILFGDVVVGPRGVVKYTLPLPNGNVTVEQNVCEYDEQGVPQCGREPARSPWPAALAVGGLAAAALARRRT